jgi:2-haloacid dehalogenase
VPGIGCQPGLMSPRGSSGCAPGSRCAHSPTSFAQITSLIKNAGLHFDCVPGADISRHYKPDVEIYRSIIELLDAAPSELMMVAAHGWDLAGARAAG